MDFLWQTFITLPSYQGIAEDLAHYHSEQAYQSRPLSPESLSYKECMKALKPLLLLKSYQTLGARYRNYKSKHTLKKTTITVKQETAERIRAAQVALGFDRNTEQGIDAALEYIIAAEPSELSESLPLELQLALANQQLSAKERSALLLANAPAAVHESVAALLKHAYLAGWEQGRKTKVSTKAKRDADKLSDEQAKTYLAEHLP